MQSLDAHAHIAPQVSGRDLAGLRACVVAVTRSLEEYKTVSDRADPSTAWAIGVHPNHPSAQQSFSVERFGSLLESAVIVGEVGLDGRSRVPMTTQMDTFRAVLECLREDPRIVTVHTAGATAAAVDLIREHVRTGCILHWWRGNAQDTRTAIDLGCYFSVNAHEVTNPKVLEYLPRDRVLTETDHPYGDRGQQGPRRPGHVHRVESALAELWKSSIGNVRRQVWQNLRRLAIETHTADRLPSRFQEQMLSA